jgi:hypothetical protein
MNQNTDCEHQIDVYWEFEVAWVKHIYQQSRSNMNLVLAIFLFMTVLDIGDLALVNYIRN